MFQGAVGGILMRFYRHFTESKMARARFLRWVGGFAVLFLLICPGPAQAACTSPAGNAGDIIWSSSSNSPAYCNNTNWIGFPKGSSTFQGAVVDAGDAHTCGLLNGALYCWGNNVNGRTGLGTTTGEQLVPAQVGVATDWTRVSAGATHSCGIRAGALYCWGSNANARTGLGTISGEQLTPAQVGSSTGWTAIGAEGATHSCGIDAGAMYCWGSNVSGRTGLGLTTSNTTAPTQVGAPRIGPLFQRAVLRLRHIVAAFVLVPCIAGARTPMAGRAWGRQPGTRQRRHRSVSLRIGRVSVPVRRTRVAFAAAHCIAGVGTVRRGRAWGRRPGTRRRRHRLVLIRRGRLFPPGIDLVAA